MPVLSRSQLRKCEVILLDGRSVELSIEPQLYAGTLFDRVASHFNLTEKEYFGLAFVDETGQYSWLSLDCRVLEHEYAQSCLPAPSTATGALNAPTPGASEPSNPRGVANNKANKLKKLKAKRASKQHTTGSGTDATARATTATAATTTTTTGSKSNLPSLLRQKLRHGNAAFSRLVGSMTSGSSLSAQATGSEKASTLPNSLRKLNAGGAGSSGNILTSLSNGLDEHPLYDVIRDDGRNTEPALYRSHPSLRRPKKKRIELEDTPSQLQLQQRRLSFPNLQVESSIDKMQESKSLRNSQASSDVHSLKTNSDYYDLDTFYGAKPGEEEDEEGDEEEEDDAELLDDDDNHLVLYFLVKYFVESISMLQDTITIELFFLQAKSLFMNEIIQVDLDTSLLLSALILQALYGDLVNESKTRARIHRQQVLTSLQLRELGSLATGEDRIVATHRSLQGVSRGDSIYRFMKLVERQPAYGVHFYEVKDKTNTLYWLGLSFKGISQFDHKDRTAPLKHFGWKQLENLYYRGRKFSIEVSNLKRVVHTLSSVNLYENAIEDVGTFDDLSSAICDPTTQVSVSRRTFGPCNVSVLIWFASTVSLTKCIWSMAIGQHQFYDERRTKDSGIVERSKEEIISALNDNYRRSLLLRTHPVPNGRSLAQPNARHSLASSNSQTNSSNSSLSLGPPPLSLSSVSLVSLPNSLNHTESLGDSTSLVLRRSRAGSHKNMNSVKNCKKNLQRHLALLEKQLNCKIDEMQKLDSLEKNILEMALHRTSSDGTLPNCAAIESTTSQHRPLSSTLSTTNSLKNFVVTGRGQQTRTGTPTSGGSSIDSNSLCNETSLGGVGYHSFINHQRSKSIGPSSRLSSASSSSFSGLPATNYSHLQASLDRKSAKRHAMLACQNRQASEPPNVPKAEAVAKNAPSRTTIEALPNLITPSYVNKYDTPLQHVNATPTVHGSNNTSNAALYSVPNRRTSIVLNSFDDSYLASKATTTAKIIKSNEEPLKLRECYNKMIVSRAPNSLTLTSLTYKKEPLPPLPLPVPASSPSSHSSNSSSSQARALAENIYATIDSMSSSYDETLEKDKTSSTFLVESCVDDVDNLRMPPPLPPLPSASRLFNLAHQALKSDTSLCETVKAVPVHFVDATCVAATSGSSMMHNYSNYANVALSSSFLPQPVSTTHLSMPRSSGNVVGHRSTNSISGLHPQSPSSPQITTNHHAPRQAARHNKSQSLLYENLASKVTPTPTSSHYVATPIYTSHAKKNNKTWSETELDFPTGNHISLLALKQMKKIDSYPYYFRPGDPQMQEDDGFAVQQLLRKLSSRRFEREPESSVDDQSDVSLRTSKNLPQSRINHQNVRKSAQSPTPSACSTSSFSSTSYGQFTSLPAKVTQFVNEQQQLKPGSQAVTPGTPTIPISASCTAKIVEVDVVNVGQFRPGYEEEKPYELEDFYKYSQKYRNASKNKQTSAATTSGTLARSNGQAEGASAQVQTLEHRLTNGTSTTTSTSGVIESDDINNNLSSAVY